MVHTKTRPPQRLFLAGLAVVFVLAFLLLGPRAPAPRGLPPRSEGAAKREADHEAPPAVKDVKKVKPADTVKSNVVNAKQGTLLERAAGLPPRRVDYTPVPAAEAATAPPLSDGTPQCPVKTPANLKHTGKRALVLYSLTNRDRGSTHTVEMDNFAFFAQHGLFPAGFKTALFTQVDYVLQRVPSPTTKTISECSRGLQSSNIKILSVPTSPCDLCSISRVLKHLGVDAKSEEYAYIVSINSGTRGPFFTMPAKTEENDGELPFTWIDQMALGGGSQFSEKVISAAAVSLQLISHFQTYAFGCSTLAMGVLDELFQKTCDESIKDGCIFSGELLGARTAFSHGLRVRSLLHFTDQSFGTEEAMEKAIGETKIVSPLISRIVYPCSMIFAKFGGETLEKQHFEKSYVDTIIAQSMAQTAVAHRLIPSKDAATIFGRAYFRCAA